IGLLRSTEKIARFFQWGWNLADRLTFAEVVASGKPLTADMSETYQVFGINPDEITTLESYMQEYFSRIMKKLKELEYEREKAKAKKKGKSLFR
ncbi:MAG TPA: 3-beta hydroxysteroid dehydrogenase, partial [Allocoleopsis sp.]